ncbi:PREDICTED: F-box protein At5g36730-like [Brassica oleracea var. oleracea]|uniref:F-box protein At5g36730-like n=1 Tax=Brassica oleracea var. oleracea TaxID=109376 RepID=UPI0006A739E3|nr:PREDICTED: F-box protein At5g36730-like [Brassica oleracea var. oleracea]
MTMMISKLPIDLVEEILSRVPLKSIGAVRSTCKKWNACFRDKHISKTGKEFLMNTRDHRVYLINVNHYKTHVNKFDLSVKRKGTLMTRENSGEVISIRWIKWPSGRFEEDQIAFGYNKSSCGIFGVSLKGDYYSYARDQESHGFLRCFDFTIERFGPRLPLPVDLSIVHGVSLSTVREEQLGLLVNRSDTYKMEVWVTNKTEPDAVLDEFPQG